VNLALAWGLAAAVAWGTADFCAKKTSNRFGFWPTVWGMNTVGAIMLSVAGAGGAISLPTMALPRLAVMALGNAIGGVFFYYALEHGPLALVSPITAAYPVVSAFLAYWFAGERLGPWMAAAVAGVIAGTLLASLGAGQDRPQPAARLALPAAIASALTFGAVFYALAATAAATSAAAPVLVFRLVGAGVLALPLLFGHRLPRGLFRSGWLWATGLLDSAAYLFYASGARHLPVSVDSALSGLFSVWTLVLAVLFLRERLGRRQWLGVALIFAAVALLALQH
jgi:drug/metabolite transporter (DMT)-like permease